MKLINLSIRKKITYSFYLLLLFMTGVVVLTYAIVQRVEGKVAFGEVINDFFNNTLEVRRFEKNYFLYGQTKDYEENNIYCSELEDFLRHNLAELRRIVKSERVDKITESIALYRLHMKRLYNLNLKFPLAGTKIERAQLEELIRAAGKDITDFAEQTSTVERKSITNLLRATRTGLISSIVAVVFLSLAIAAVLGRSVVNSLRVLESYTRKISQGKFIEASKWSSEEEIHSLLMAFNRITREMRIRQQQLVQSKKLAALGTLLSGVAHELNNPLSNISTSAQILAEEIEDHDLEFKRNLIAQIETQSDRARDIVKTLLEFSRVKEFSKQELSLRKLLDETIVLIRGQVPSAVEIAVDIPADLQISADKQRMQQVFLNLIKNAVDAVEGQGHIWVSARATRINEMDELEILIEDDGPGIAPENVRKIFDPFFTTKDIGQGSGLGLFIVHDIVEGHGGTINVESRVGQGTTFIIWLPKEQRKEA